MKTHVNSGMVIVSVLILLALCGLVSAVEDSNLISHWKFDEGEGSTVYDSAGNNDGTVYGAVWTTGQIDGALNFDGLDDYVRTPNNVFTNAQLASGATLSAWFNTDSTAYYGCIADNEGYLTLGVNHIYAANPNKLFGIVDGGYHRFFSSSDVIDNLWHLAAIVWDGTNTAILYLDGVNVSSGVSYPPTPDSKDRPFAIGAHSTIAAYFDGTIDDVRVYDRALSAEEIWQLYQEGLSVLVAIDIKPQSCPNPLNLKSRGVLPVAVLGSEDFDVNSIDAASIRLADVAPIRSSFEDVATPVADGNECECTTEGPDGYTDLTLKFKTQEIVEKLINAYGELAGGQMLSLTLTGALYDGTLIEGTDCVRLVGNVPRAIAAKRADINGDGVVDFRDLTIVSKYWLESAELE